MEVSLVIGIVDCPSSPCPAPSVDLGDILFIGKYKSQGVIGDTLESFENFTFNVPANFTGSASFQAQHNSLLTPPVSLFHKHSNLVILTLFQKNQAIPTVEYQSLAVEVSSLS